MQCNVCEYDNSPDARFCVNCGAALELLCPNCGHGVTAGQNFCGNCGHDLRSHAREAASPASYTPAHLAQRILDERHLIVGERKLVTVMFADIVGSTAAIEHRDPEEAATFLTQALGAMMDAVHAYEGTVNELRGDGIMALFGAPIAHEDHAVRACRAALEIPDAVATATAGASQTRVGIHTGEVLVREVGNDLSVEYQALGPTVHLAARMEGLAEPGTTYITRDVRRLVDGSVETRSVGSREVKGITESVEVYALTRALDATPWEARAARGLATFTGREQEMGRVSAALAEVTPDRGRVVVVLGDAGVGKSRLVHEFLEATQLDDFQLIRTEATPFDINTSFYPIKNAIHGWLGTEPAGPEIVDRLHAALRELDPQLQAAATPLAAMLDVPIADTEWVEASPGVRKRRTRNAIRALALAFAKRKPLVLIVEDLHWIDGETQTVLDDLVELAATSPILMILTHRPEYSDLWTAKPHVRRVHLESLDAGNALALLDHLVGNDPSLEDLKPLIAARSEGTPLFLEEIVKALVDGDTLVGSPGSYQAVSHQRELQIPESVQAVIAARIDRLEAHDKHVLQVASVAGARVELRLIAEAAGKPLDDVVATMQRLRSREFLYEAQVLPVAVYRFSHALVRDVAYSSLPLTQRKSLHAAMVDAIEADGGDGEATIERLAFHALRGELGARAVEYASQAADKAIERSAYRDADVFLRDALEAQEALPQDRAAVERGIDLRMRMRVASTGATGGLKRNLSDLAEAQEMAAAIEDPSRQGLLAIHRGYAANMLGDAALAVDQSHRAEDLATRLEDPLLAIEARVLRAQALDYSGRPNQVAALIAEDFEYLASEVRHDTLGQTMIRSVVAGAHLAMAAAAMGRFDESVRYETEATAIANEAGRPFDQMYMCWSRGFRLDFQGAPAESVAAHQESVAIADEHDIWFMTTFAQPWLGHALIRAGRADEGLQLLRRLEGEAQRVELPYVEALSQAFASLACQAMGDTEATRAYAAAALAFHEEFPNPIIELVARTALGRVGAGKEDAVAHLAAAAALARTNGYEPWLAELEAEHR